MVEALHSIATLLGKLFANRTLGQLARSRLRRLQSAYEPYVPATFFAGGFAFDVATGEWITLLEPTSE